MSLPDFTGKLCINKLYREDIFTFLGVNRPDTSNILLRYEAYSDETLVYVNFTCFTGKLWGRTTKFYQKTSGLFSSSGVSKFATINALQRFKTYSSKNLLNIINMILQESSVLANFTKRIFWFSVLKELAVTSVQSKFCGNSKHAVRKAYFISICLILQESSVLTNITKRILLFSFL